MSATDAPTVVGSDLVLLLLAAPTKIPAAQDKIYGITRLEKLLYIAQMESTSVKDVSNPLKFEAYNFGPYSKAVYEAVDILERVGLLEEERVQDGRTLDSEEEIQLSGEDAEYVERRFSLTADGKAVAKLLSESGPAITRSLSKVKDEYARLSLDALIRYVYTKYPESAENSLIRDRYLPR